MAHQNLIEIRHLLKQCLAGVTNNHQAAGLKYRFKSEFIKGTKIISTVDSKSPIKNYYKLEIYLDDYTNEKVEEITNDLGELEKVKTGSVRTNLFRYAMPHSIKVSKDKMEEEAIRAFFLYSVNSGLMVQMQMSRARAKQDKLTNIEGNEFYEIQTLTDIIKDNENR